MRTLTLLLPALLLASCSKPQKEAQSLVHEIPVATLSVALQMAEAAKVDCADATACPKNVGLLVGASGSAVGTCTAFLVGPDLVATNAHCLPSAVRMMPELCAERVRVIFPRTGDKSEESFPCETLLGQSERPNEISPDLALLRVKETGRKALAINREGVKPSAIHTTFKMNPGQNASGTIVSQTCLTVPDTYRFPLYQNEASAIFVTGDCPSIPGNSGAPLLNSAGEAVGIFQSALALDEEQRKEWAPHLKEGETFSPLALGTSLRCWPGAGWSMACAPVDPEEIVRPTIRDFLHSLEPRLREMARAFGGPVFRWKVVQSHRRLLENEYRFEPACFEPLADWADQFRISGDPLALAEEARISLPQPTFRAAMRFNRYTQIDASIEPKESSLREFLIHPAALARTGMDGDLEFCPATE